MPHQGKRISTNFFTTCFGLYPVPTIQSIWPFSPGSSTISCSNFSIFKSLFRNSVCIPLFYLKPTVTSGPVSYTHLDVYKRQVVRIAYRIIRKMRNKQLMWYVQTIFTRDVYKRQPSYLYNDLFLWYSLTTITPTLWYKLLYVSEFNLDIPCLY